VKSLGAVWNAGRKTWQITGKMFSEGNGVWDAYTPTVAPTDAPF